MEDVHTQSALSYLTTDLDAVHGVVILGLAQNELVVDIIAVLSNEFARSKKLRTERTNFSWLRRHRGSVWTGNWGESSGTRVPFSPLSRSACPSISSNLSTLALHSPAVVLLESCCSSDQISPSNKV